MGCTTVGDVALLLSAVARLEAERDAALRRAEAAEDRLYEDVKAAEIRVAAACALRLADSLDAAIKKERAKIVAWLRSKAARGLGATDARVWWARMIERGEHDR